MADTYTSVLQLLKQETGSHNNDWGNLLNSQVIDRIESAIAAESGIALTGGTKTLTDDECRPHLLSFTGTLGSDAIVEVPARSRTWILYNGTTGNFTVTVKVSGQPGFIVPRGPLAQVHCNGAAMIEVGTAGQVPVGSAIHHFGATVPSNFLEMDGTAISRVLYAKLFAAIGSTWGAGDGSTTFNLPNAKDRYFRARGTTFASLGYVAQDIQSHTHTASTDTQGFHGHTGVTSSVGNHNHSYTTWGTINLNVPAGAVPVAAGPTTVNTGNDGAHSHTLTIDGNGSHAHNVTVGSTGGTETRPNSIIGLACIRYQ